MHSDKSDDFRNKNMEFDNWDDAPLKTALLRSIYAYDLNIRVQFKKKLLFQ